MSIMLMSKIILMDLELGQVCACNFRKRMAAYEGTFHNLVGKGAEPGHNHGASIMDTGCLAGSQSKSAIFET